MILLAKYILAHLVGDFLLQPFTWVKNKEDQKARSPFLYFHVLIHLALLLLLVGFGNWLPALIISVLHLFIDMIKLHFQKEANKPSWFVADQIMHIITILVVWYLFHQPEIIQPEFTTSFWILAAVVVFLTTPASYFIAAAMSSWSNLLAEANEDALPKAGQYIGILERLLVFAFIALGQWSAIGFLLGAKSIFRFGDLTRSKDRRLTEYILVGTLLSFGLAILMGMICYYFNLFGPVTR